MPIWAIAVLVLAVVVAIRAGRVWLKYRGDRVIVCPENHQPAGVALAVGPAVGHAATLSLWSGGELRLASCSRWPERSGCGQQCLSQIQASPEDCLVRNILTRWYHGKSCVWCGLPFGEIQWAVRKPALLDRCGMSMEWTAIPAEKLQETLAEALPVCFACHMANTLVREHPELAIQRPVLPGKRTDQ